MSMINYAGCARMLQLMGGVSLSFYDWYADLPPASPETWGEQTDARRARTAPALLAGHSEIGLLSSLELLGEL